MSSRRVRWALWRRGARGGRGSRAVFGEAWLVWFGGTEVKEVRRVGMRRWWSEGEGWVGAVVGECGLCDCCRCGGGGGGGDS